MRPNEQLYCFLLSVFLLFTLGWLLVRVGVRHKSDSVLEDVIISLPFGILAVSILGALFLWIPHPFGWALLSIDIILGGWIVWQKRALPILPENLNFLRGVAILSIPVVFSCALASYSFSHFDRRSIRNGLHPWFFADDLQLYHIPDHILQFQVSENFYLGNPIETGFNPDGRQLWSVGDRPILIGLLDAALTLLTNSHHFNLYLIRIFFLSSFFLLPLIALLRDEFQVGSRWVIATLTIYMAAHPFFFSNILYTWPKMAGVTLTLIGWYMLCRVRLGMPNLVLRKTYLIAALSFACAMLCHAASVIGVCLVFLYLLLTRWKAIFAVAKTDRFAALKPAILGFLAAFILIEAHSFYLKIYTNQTNLLARVQLCLGGNYAEPTPVISVAEACRAYFNQYGIAGIIEHRLQSLSRALIEFYPLAYSLLNDLVFGKVEWLNIIRAWTKNIMFLPVFAYGVLTVPLFVFSSCINALLHRMKLGFYSKENMLFVASIAALFGFGCMLAVSSEMMPHVIPYHITLLMQVALLLSLARLSRITFFCFAVIGITLSSAMIISRASDLFVYRTPSWAGLSVKLFIVTALLILAVSRPNCSAAERVN